MATILRASGVQGTRWLPALRSRPTGRGGLAMRRPGKADRPPEFLYDGKFLEPGGGIGSCGVDRADFSRKTLGDLAIPPGRVFAFVVVVILVAGHEEVFVRSDVDRTDAIA